MKMTVFWDVALCILVEVYQRFRGAYCLHHQGNDYTAQHLRRWSYKNMFGKPEGKGPFGRPRRREKYNIKMDIKKFMRMATRSNGLRIGTGGGLL
jgi:hypothetical protein